MCIFSGTWMCVDAFMLYARAEHSSELCDTHYPFLKIQQLSFPTHTHIYIYLYIHF